MAKIIAIDAGHGINTAGKRTPAGEREWSFNTVVAGAVIKELRNYEGVKTVRLDDPSGKRDVPLSERTNKANAAKADVLISCHHNANTGRWGNWTGTETYHYPGSSKGRRLATVIHPYMTDAYKLRDRGIKSANFHMLRESNMPAILIEGGFMDSSIDIKKLRDKAVLKRAGRNIAEGIAEYFGLKKKATKAPSKPSSALYKIQIGAFSKKANADNLARRAKAKGFDQYIVKEGGLYKVQIGAFSQKANADEAVKKAKKAGFDVYIIGGKSVNKAKAKSSKPSPKPKPKSAPIKVGDKVTMSNSAKRYATGEIIPTRYKGKRYTVQQISGDRALLKELFSWVNVKDIGGPKKPAKPALKAGSRVTLKTSAKTYATGEAIPARIKGKRYTIQQVSKGRVLLKEIFSWVRNSDVI